MLLVILGIILLICLVPLVLGFLPSATLHKLEKRLAHEKERDADSPPREDF